MGLKSFSHNSDPEQTQRIRKMVRRKQKPKIFISHSYKDEKSVRALREALSDMTEVVVLDPMEETTEGENFTQKIGKILKRSDVVVTLLSPESTHNPNVLMELGMATALGKIVIPVVWRETDISSIPFRLRNRGIIKNTGPKSTAERLKRRVLDL
jgi:predicted nucleotide-binding protein